MALCVGVAAAASAQFASFSDRTNAILEGNWQSCRESDGIYSERVYDAKLPGGGEFELHMGPFREFALFRGIQAEHREHHSTDNLLRPYDVEVVSNRARQVWDVAGLRLEVRLGGGSAGDCESWFVTLARSAQTSSD
jgi:hypothetical protein